jgi:beta-ureidopropionase / N-carbamoyl-L-amino-acid hydrolase
MPLRKDALAAAQLTLEVNRIGNTFPDSARGTVGHMQVKPNSRNVIPGEVRMTVDLRNASDNTRSGMKKELEKPCAASRASAASRSISRKSPTSRPASSTPGSSLASAPPPRTWG